MAPAITGIIAAAVLIGSALLFPWLQNKGIVTLGPRSYTLLEPAGPAQVATDQMPPK